jgi:hypothetical protein
MSKFNDFRDAIFDGAESLARQSLNEAVSAARDDAKDFFEATKNNLRDWTRQLADGQLKKREFESLVKGEKDLATLFALTQAGIQAARIQRFRDALIKLVIDAAFKTFL